MHPHESPDRAGKRFSLLARLRSFRYAAAGLVYLFRQEPNAQIHLVATAAAIGLGYWRGLSRTEWMILVLTVAAVWATEAINTAIEMLCDLYCEGKYHPVIKVIKDVAAAAALIAAIASIIVGALLFL